MGSDWAALRRWEKDAESYWVCDTLVEKIGTSWFDT